MEELSVPLMEDCINKVPVKVNIREMQPRVSFSWDGRVECTSDGRLHQQSTCEDIDECNFFDEDEDTDYSLVSYDEQILPSVNYYPCEEPATCVNTEGSFACKCRLKPVTACDGFISCDDLQPPEFGTIIEQSQIHTAYTCNDGYRLEGSEIRKCVNGRWSGVQPICQVTTCPLPAANIANGWSDVENRTYTHGEEIHYGCDEGFKLVDGNSWSICANTQWTSRTPSCRAIQCPDPGQIINGLTLLYSRNIGGEVHFRCNSGNFQLRGSPVRRCQANGRWDGTITTCNNPETYCPTPAVPFNGRVSGSTSYNHDDVITFECNYGFDLIGSSQRRCTTTGQWSGEQPECRGIGEFDDLEAVGRHLVEATSNFRDGFTIQRTFKGESVNNSSDQQPLINGPAKPGRLATIPLESSVDGQSRGLDVYFVFDVSKSVQLGKTHIEAIRFAKAFVEKVGVSGTGVGGTRYGAIAYASKPIVVFQMTDNSTERVLQGLDSIEDLVTHQHLGQGTATSSALNLVHSNIMKHTSNSPQLRGKRVDTDKVLFLLTDGQSNMNGSPDEEASKLKTEFDVAIHCIGIGNDVNRQELKVIASQPESEHVFTLEDFKTLDELTSTITVTPTDYSICGVSAGPENTDEGVGEADDVWPWQAALYTHIERKGTPTFFCGGTLIAPNWILTAAHCFDPQEAHSLPGRDVPDNLVVYMGMNDRIKEGFRVPGRAQKREVKRIVNHSSYDSSIKPTYDYDMALLELQEPFELGPFVRTICLPPSTNWQSLMTPGEQNKPFATGWGKVDFQDRHLSDHLKQIALPIRDDKFCRVTESERHGNLTERMLCAGYSDGTADTCDGDSGGPLMRRWLRPSGEDMSTHWRESWYQIGIISWGENCAKKKHYGYYTHLPLLVEWVNDIIG
ncbi:complement factor B-like [Amphiura filiformis]|uniref:complement factor B-like n=1 Tax=Amphiura filiformis TaxID=82378 RepID=UPI003B20D4BB